MTASAPVNMLPRHRNTSATLEQLCKDTVMTIWHCHGGCQIGEVVGADYKVLGVDALRVIDGSTSNASPGTNPQATVMMLERYIGVTPVETSKTPVETSKNTVFKLTQVTSNNSSISFDSIETSKNAVFKTPIIITKMTQLTMICTYKLIQKANQWLGYNSLRKIIRGRTDLSPFVGNGSNQRAMTFMNFLFANANHHLFGVPLCL
ncbi:Protein HOTHEAD [Linum grandiflorum]